MNFLEQQDKMIQVLLISVSKQCCLLCTGFLSSGYVLFGTDWLFVIMEFGSDGYSLRLLRMEKKSKTKIYYVGFTSLKKLSFCTSFTIEMWRYYLEGRSSRKWKLPKKLKKISIKCRERERLKGFAVCISIPVHLPGNLPWVRSWDQLRVVADTEMWL